jgi:hypothetical protein
MKGWETRQIDFGLAFPQADVECDIYMEVPVGFNLKKKKKESCLKLHKNIYGTKQAGPVWNKHVNKGSNDTWIQGELGGFVRILSRKNYIYAVRR